MGGDELNWVNLGRVDPATLQATKIACAHPPSLSLSGLVSNFRRTGIIVRGYVWGTFGSVGCLHPPVTNKVWYGRIEILVSAVEICISSKA